MEKTISFFKGEFPKEALEVQECIDLLNQCIAGSIESIKNAFNTAIDQRDFNKITELNELLLAVDNIQSNLEHYSNILQLDDDIEEGIIEKPESVICECLTYTVLYKAMIIP